MIIDTIINIVNCYLTRLLQATSREAHANNSPKRNRIEQSSQHGQSKRESFCGAIQHACYMYNEDWQGESNLWHWVYAETRPDGHQHQTASTLHLVTVSLPVILVAHTHASNTDAQTLSDAHTHAHTHTHTHTACVLARQKLYSKHQRLFPDRISYPTAMKRGTIAYVHNFISGL